MTPKADLIALAVLNEFSKLPSKSKPIVRDNGAHEWVPVSGIVAETDGKLTCLALATGMKCLPAAKLAASNGVGLHDWHAEVLAIRTFNRYLLDESLSLAQSGSKEHAVIRRTVSGTKADGGAFIRPFEIRPDVKLHMYCSEAPCGDASMELIMAAQEDASPWEYTVSLPNQSASDATDLPGRAYFSELGIVRRKPGRRDASPTLSKSCSDKLSLHQCTSLLSSLASLLIDPSNAYIDSFILPESQYSRTACQRAFSADGRMKSIATTQWDEGYTFTPFTIETTLIEFEYSKRTVSCRADTISGSNAAAAWSLSGFQETILGGVLKGRRLSDYRGASHTSRRQMWIAVRDLVRQLDSVPEWLPYICQGTYQDVKDCILLTSRRAVKASLRSSVLSGWGQNSGDSSFEINHTA